LLSFPDQTPTYLLEYEGSTIRIPCESAIETPQWTQNYQVLNDPITEGRNLILNSVNQSNNGRYSCDEDYNVEAILYIGCEE